MHDNTDCWREIDLINKISILYYSRKKRYFIVYFSDVVYLNLIQGTLIPWPRALPHLKLVQKCFRIVTWVQDHSHDSQLDAKLNRIFEKLKSSKIKLFIPRLNRFPRKTSKINQTVFFRGWTYKFGLNGLTPSCI